MCPAQGPQRSDAGEVNQNQQYKSTNVRFYSSYDFKITLKSDFCRKKVIILSLCTQRCYVCHNVSGKSVNHKWFIDSNTSFDKYIKLQKSQRCTLRLFL